MSTLKDKIVDIVHAEQICAIDNETMLNKLHSLLLEEVSKAIKNERLYQNGVSNISSEQYIEQLNKG